MKKYLILYIIFFSNVLYSQITLEHQINVNDVRDTYFIKTENGEIKYIYVDKNNWIVKIFNIDNTINTTIAINRNSLYNTNDYPNGGKFKIYAITQHLFDNDNEFEFLIEFVASSSNYSNRIQKTAVIDASGDVIFSVDNQMPPYESEANKPFITNTTQGTKMMLISSDLSTDTVTGIYIYSLPGTLSSNIINNLSSSYSFRIYPNPVSNRMLIQYSLPSNCENAEIILYNSLNQEVQRSNIDTKKKNKELLLNDLTKGIYLIRIVGDNYKSNIKRIIIN